MNDPLVWERYGCNLGRNALHSKFSIEALKREDLAHAGLTRHCRADDSSETVALRVSKGRYEGNIELQPAWLLLAKGV